MNTKNSRKPQTTTIQIFPQDMSKDIDTELTSDSNRGLIVVPGISSGPDIEKVTNPFNKLTKGEFDDFFL